MLQTLGTLVERESPSQDKAALGRLAQHLAQEFTRRGGKPTFHPQEKNGPHLQVEFAAGSGKPLLLLGHYDTVWEMGTLSRMPWRIERERAYGPGVFDMKGGIVQALFALETLAGNGRLPRPVMVLLVSDEEIGSDSSRSITEALAKKASAVLVLEPAHGLDGACKTARKGVGDFIVRVRGVSAHAGLDFEKGHNAVLELARQIERVAGFTELKRGLTVSPGVVKGGTRGNVVPDLAEVLVDVRIARASDGARIEKKFRTLRPQDRQCRVEIEGGINRPPLERTAAVAGLYARAREIARELGFELKESAVGGGSDGNFT
ncbi:MAG TPA: M20 family metallopeptidase, partial [Terriglobales bacterium]|nr:M20 family metallopeptidase [Terriglobales bacterium]